MSHGSQVTRKGLRLALASVVLASGACRVGDEVLDESSQDCHASIFTGDERWPHEIDADTNGEIEVAALLFPSSSDHVDVDRFRVSVLGPLKIVWRVTGEGEVTMQATNPAGRQIGPIGGLTEHASSSFDRPGDEWGTEWEFDEIGCWTIEVRRGDGVATITAEVG